MLCARECPDWCIYIDSHKETLPAPEGGRPRARNMLDRFAIDFSLCMYCGICIEVCPFDALFWSPEFEYAEGDIRNLLHEKDKLAGWARTVPPPPAHDPNADPPKELAAGTRPARTPSGPGAGRTAGAPAGGSAGGSRGGSPGGAASGPGASGVVSEEPGSPAGPSQEPETAAPSPERPARRASAERMNVRSIRPPGALPREETEGPSSGNALERPTRRASAGRMNVRAIRPPGALPKKDTPPLTDSSAEGEGGRPGPADVGETGSPGAEASAGRGADRPVRRVSTGPADVRAIKPPGAFPEEDGSPPGEAETGTSDVSGSSAGGGDSRALTGHADAGAGRQPGAPPKEDTPSSGEVGRKLSTGDPAGEKLSTGGGGASPAEGATEQTFATEPNSGLQEPREPQEPEESQEEM
ncbi:4Fe-4S binding protein [Streptosporangium saharense]|uniref:4Fe-4S binding protein n=1 Tax=Streptosporangium saharense TaxID=1706840 RepID=UPI00332C2C50